jgi:hypothetical protein
MPLPPECVTVESHLLYFDGFSVGGVGSGVVER